VVVEFESDTKTGEVADGINGDDILFTIADGSDDQISDVN
jgi:hypothetical protein